MSPSLSDRHATSAARHRTRARGAGVGARPGQALERGQGLVVGLDPPAQPRDPVEHLRAPGLDPVGPAVGVERGGGVVELAVVERAEVAQHPGPGTLVGAGRPPAQQIDQRRPLGGVAVEALERVVGPVVAGRQGQHPLVAVGGAVAVALALERVGELLEPADPGAVVAGRAGRRGHRVERQLAPAIGGVGQAEQGIEIARGRRLGEGLEPGRQRTILVAELVLEVVGQLAQDLGAPGAVLDLGQPVELGVDDHRPVALGRRPVEQGLDPDHRPVERRPDPGRVDLGQLIDEERREHAQRVRGKGAFDRHAGN